MTIRIMGRPYTVEFAKGYLSNDTVMGRASSLTAQIFVRADMDPFGQRQTLLHEILHSIGDDCDLGLTEVQVSVLANGLASIEELHLEIAP